MINKFMINESTYTKRARDIERLSEKREKLVFGLNFLSDRRLLFHEMSLRHFVSKRTIVIIAQNLIKSPVEMRPLTFTFFFITYHLPPKAVVAILILCRMRKTPYSTLSLLRVFLIFLSRGFFIVFK